MKKMLFSTFVFIKVFAEDVNDVMQEKMYELLVDKNKIAEIKKETDLFLAKEDKKQIIEKVADFQQRECEKTKNIKKCGTAYFLLNLVYSYKNKATQKCYNILLNEIKTACDKNKNADYCFLFSVFIDDGPMNEYTKIENQNDANLTKMSAEYNNLACEYGNKIACELRIFYYAYVLENQNMALNLAEDYCLNQNNINQCLNLADFYSERGFSNNLGKNSYPDAKKAIKYLEKVSNASLKAKYFLSVELVRDMQCKKALELLKSMCSDKNNEACSFLGDLHVQGKCVRYSVQKAKEHYGLACDYGSQYGCAKYKDLSF